MSSILVNFGLARTNTMGLVISGIDRFLVIAVPIFLWVKIHIHAGLAKSLSVIPAGVGGTQRRLYATSQYFYVYMLVSRRDGAVYMERFIDDITA
jgi:hypothetical protein